MARVNKFRAWDAEAEVFYYSDEHHDGAWFEFKGKALKAYVVEDKGYGPPEERLHVRELEPVEQFTGLYDKNGAEIWEGDVIQPAAYIYAKGLLVATVVRKNGMFALPSGRSLHESLVGAANAGNPYQIVGNIHKNPELARKRW